MDIKNCKITLIVVFVLFVFGITYLAINLDFSNPNDQLFSLYDKKIDNELAIILENQRKKDDELKSIYESDKYTIDEPFIEANPYSISPLSAIIIFSTEKSEAVDVYLNDKFATKMESSNRHAIPIYGLYSSGNNIVRLELSSGEKKEYEISTNLYNYEVGKFDLATVADKKSTVMLIGDLENAFSNVRAFDYNNNLTFYLDLDYIGSYNIENDKIKVGYNSKKDLGLINLEIDYLGKIYSIESDTSKLLSERNISLNGEYMFIPINYYTDDTKNYQFENYKYLEDYTYYELIYTNDIRKYLKDAKSYDKQFIGSFNGDYLSWENIYLQYLVVVNYENAYSTKYNIDNLNMIRMNIKDDNMSLFGINFDGNYYKLDTMLKIK